MKAILISIKPKYVAKILNRDKTIVVRKDTALYKATQKLIDEYGHADIYVYCSKKESLRFISFKGWCNGNAWKKERPLASCSEDYSGKVIFKFRCYEMEEIYRSGVIEDVDCDTYETKSLYSWELCQKSCLELDEFNEYFNSINTENVGYAIHISDLEIFDKPKELSEFNALQRAKAADCGYLKQCKNCGKRFNRCHLLKPLTKAPRGWCYVEIGE